MRIVIFRTRIVAAALSLMLLAAGNAVRSQDAGSAADRYEYTTPTRDGIGKLYMGREISQVMGHLGAAWLERDERQREERTDLLLENLPLEAGSRVADIGAGTGYFSLPMADIVGATGRVYAVDIQPEMLAIIEERAARGGVYNIERVLATERDPGLPPESIDVALFVDAYHEFEWPYEVMSAVFASLVPGGQVVLIEYRAEDPAVPIKPLHKLTERQARRELEAVGFEFVANRRLLPQQHFLIFEKPAAQ